MATSKTLTIPATVRIQIGFKGSDLRIDETLDLSGAPEDRIAHWFARGLRRDIRDEGAGVKSADAKHAAMMARIEAMRNGQFEPAGGQRGRRDPIYTDAVSLLARKQRKTHKEIREQYPTLEKLAKTKIGREAIKRAEALNADW